MLKYSNSSIYKELSCCLVNFAWREGFGIQGNVHFMKLWCTLLQFWISNPWEFSVFFQKMDILSENTLGFVLWFFYMLFVCTYISLVQFSHSVVSDSLRRYELQHARPPYPSPTPGVYSDSCASSGDAIQPSFPLSSPFPPAPNPSQHHGLFQWVNIFHEVAKLLEFQLQHQSFQ